jgi:hypothetical protein
MCEKLLANPIVGVRRNVLSWRMRRIKPQTTPQPTPDAHGRPWHEIALLVGYLVICLLSVLTVLLPTTENKEEQPDRKAQGTADSADSAANKAKPAK